MDNKTIANIFYETADLMEVAASDPFRIRSYRCAPRKKGGGRLLDAGHHLGVR